MEAGQVLDWLMSQQPHQRTGTEALPRDSPILLEDSHDLPPKIGGRPHQPRNSNKLSGYLYCSLSKEMNLDCSWLMVSTLFPCVRHWSEMVMGLDFGQWDGEGNLLEISGKDFTLWSEKHENEKAVFAPALFLLSFLYSFLPSENACVWGYDTWFHSSQFVTQRDNVADMLRMAEQKERKNLGP